MTSKNSIIIVLIAALFSACTPTTEDGSKYVGNWQTPPAPSNRSGEQYFIEIALDTPPNYIAKFSRKGSISHGISYNNVVAQTHKSVYSMKEGKLVSTQGSTIYLDSQGVLHYNNIEYRK